MNTPENEMLEHGGASTDGFSIEMYLLQANKAVEIKPSHKLCHLLIFAAKGSVAMVRGPDRLQLKPGELHFASFAHLCLCLHTDHSSTVWVLDISQAYLQANGFKTNGGICSKFSQGKLNGLTLPVEDHKALHKLLKLTARHLAELKSPNSADILHLGFNLVLNIIGAGNKIVRPEAAEIQNRAGFIASRFLLLVSTHARQRHDVAYYSDALCITRGHLAKILKYCVGQSPKKIIEATLAEEASDMLKNFNSTIYTIAEDLNFGSASSFTNFYKRHTGQTPSEYRKNL